MLPSLPRKRESGGSQIPDPRSPIQAFGDRFRGDDRVRGQLSGSITCFL
jgi:hypothetical protein